MTNKLLINIKVQVDEITYKILHSTQNTKSTFQSKDSRIRIHKSGICSNRPPQRLIWHAHINNNNTILWRRFSNTYILV